ncbi:MAG: XrtA system polysaccharide deacetylase [Pyrinomonadaceae bacterium]
MRQNAFTVDLEDWYHGIELPYADWASYSPRLEKGFYTIFDLLEEHDAKATFFTLGWVAKKYPQLIKELANAGHELGSHSYSHEKVYNQTCDKFRAEVRLTKEIIENITGQKVRTHRSPFFSITSQSLWALEVLAEEGYEIDCSISPIKTWRYGISTCPDSIFRIAEINMIEFPASKFRFLSKNWAIGGAYFRLFPYSFTANGIKQRTQKQQCTMFYVHPWEYDPEHPRVKFERKAMITHYTNLNKTPGNTKKLLKQFEFDIVSNVTRNYEQQRHIESVNIKVLQD